MYNNKTITDPKQIANSFNNIFTNVSEKIQSKIRPSNQHFLPKKVLVIHLYLLNLLHHLKLWTSYQI